MVETYATVVSSRRRATLYGAHLASGFRSVGNRKFHQGIDVASFDTVFGFATAVAAALPPPTLPNRKAKEARGAVCCILMSGMVSALVGDEVTATRRREREERERERERGGAEDLTGRNERSPERTTAAGRGGRRRRRRDNITRGATSTAA